MANSVAAKAQSEAFRELVEPITRDSATDMTACDVDAGIRRSKNAE